MEVEKELKTEVFTSKGETFRIDSYNDIEVIEDQFEYVAAGAMCKANGKNLKDWFKTADALETLELYSKRIGIPIFY